MAPLPANEQAILDAARDVAVPEFQQTLHELKMLKGAMIRPDGVPQLRIELPTPAYPHRKQLAESVRSAVREKIGAGDVDIQFTSLVRGKETGGTIGLRVKNVVAVGAGKGGVGKSTIAAALAYGLHSCGANVGLMDADVYGPSIPHMVGVHEQPAMKEMQNESGQVIQRIVPLDAGGVKMISMGLIVPPDKAVIWRGPLLHRAITQFLKDTEWGELDYLIVDMPPGTGDVALTLSQAVGLAGAVVVCTPQQVALLDAVKAVNMFQQVNIPVLGMVENMSGEIFGRGGAERKAAELGLPFLGEIPIEADIRVKGDEGKMADLFAEGSPSRAALLHMCERTAMEIAKSVMKGGGLPTLEIL